VALSLTHLDVIRQFPRPEVIQQPYLIELIDRHGGGRAISHRSHFRHGRAAAVPYSVETILISEMGERRRVFYRAVSPMALGDGQLARSPSRSRVTTSSHCSVNRQTSIQRHRIASRSRDSSSSTGLRKSVLHTSVFLPLERSAADAAAGSDTAV